MKRWAAIFCVALAGCGGNGAAPPGGGDGGGASNDGGILPQPDGGGLPCSGRTLTQSGVLDLPLSSVHVTGAVTLAGQPLPLPSGATSRGGVMFSGGPSSSLSFAVLPSAGSATYDLWLAPGVYDVSYYGDATWCASGAPPLPCNSGVVKKAVTLTTSGVLDLDVPPPVMVAGAVTLNGAAMPSGVDRGSILFGGVELPLGSSGPAHYQATLYAGNYEVDWDTHTPVCDGGPLPCMNAVLKNNVTLTSSGALDVDVPAVQVAGTVTLNGATLPANAGGRGALYFTRAGGASSGASVDLGASGAATYRATLVPDTYDVAYSSPGGSCGNLPLPCNSAVVKPHVALTTSGALDVDVPAVTVTGAIKLKGAALPDAGADRGRIAIDGALTDSLGTTGAAQYRMMLVPGTYDVRYFADGGCAAFPMPCNGGVLKSQQSFQSSGVFDIDIPSIQITGAVTLNGATLPDRAGNRGQIEWGGTAAAQTLGTSGAGQYRLTLLPGTYDVSYAPSDAGCDGSTFPCVGGFLKQNVAVDHDGALDVDVRSIEINGAVTLNGGALPGGADPGELLFNSTPVAMVAPTYRATLMPGSFIVQYRSGAACSGPWPCSGEIVFGCP
jgi:hypothetical protein